MSREALLSLVFMAALAAVILLHWWFSDEGRLQRLTRSQGLANSLNLIGLAWAERKSRGEAHYLEILFAVAQHRPDAVRRWERMREDERRAVAMMARELVGPGGAEAWITRSVEEVKRLKEKMQRL